MLVLIAIFKPLIGQMSKMQSEDRSRLVRVTPPRNVLVTRTSHLRTVITIVI